jgi:outer membrane receptor protein involved in Fe transport
MRRFVATLLLSAGLVCAQTERGNITGGVRDPSGAAVPGAEVQAVNVATNVTSHTQATDAGEYNIPVPPGMYRLIINAPGFKRYLADNVTVTAASTVRLDATLEIGAVTETLQVSADLLQIQTENAKITTSVQNRLVDELPLVVGGELRSPFDLVSVVAEAKGQDATLSLGGGQARAWDATLDGLSVTTNRSADAVEIAYNAPSLEAITEFTVDTNGFKAEYGQAGGGVITFSSKSGTNDIHGSAYEFLRNDALDARGFFARTKPVYKQHDFGVTLGGPVWLPKLYNGRNRTFFFLAYEGFRNRAGTTTISTVPTPEMFQGDFSRWVDARGARLQIYDPRTQRPNPAGGLLRDPFPNNQIPTAQFSRVARQILPFGQAVRPNREGIFGIRENYQNDRGSIITPTDKGSVRVDHLIRDSHRVGFLANVTAFRRALGPGGPPGLPVPLYSGEEQAFDTTAYRLSYDWTMSPRMLNHLSVGGNWFYKNSFSPNVDQNWKDKICIPNVVDCNRNFPLLTFSEYSQWGGNSYNGTEQPHWAFKDDLSYSRGKHHLKFGTAFQSQRANGFGEQQISGGAGFSFLGTSVPGATSFTSGSSFASFLLGDANTGGTETIRFVEQIYRYHGFYVQDDWRITPRLTLNLGLRYEFTRPPINGLDEYSDFTPDRPNPAVNNYPGALRFAGFGPGRENTRALVPGWYKGWGPRLGVAFSLDSKTTLRTAFGRSFSKVTVVSGSGHFAGFIGNYRFSSPNQGVNPAFRLDEGLPPYLLPPQINPAFSNNQDVHHWQPTDAARAPENFYWTFSIQRQLSGNMVLEAAYNANVGAHLQAGLVNLNQTPTAYLNQFIQQYGATQALNLLRADINSAQARAANIPIPYPNFTNPQVQQNRTVNQALRPFPQYLAVVTGDQGGDKSGHSSYHAMVLKLERRYSSGLTMQWNYTLSKILTDADSYAAAGGAGSAQDHYNRGLEKSIGQFDQTHVVKLATVYELPVGKGRRFFSGMHPVANHILGGWRISAIQSYFSGQPIALTRNNPFAIFNGTTRPVITGYENWRAPLRGEKFDPAVDRFLNLAAFPAQPNDRFGNATRYNPKVRSFPQFNENISLAKAFHLKETVRLDFRWEAFNLFNRTRFATGPTNVNSATFGVVSSQANDARQMQVALKLYW